MLRFFAKIFFRRERKNAEGAEGSEGGRVEERGGNCAAMGWVAGPSTPPVAVRLREVSAQDDPNQPGSDNSRLPSRRRTA